MISKTLQNLHTFIYALFILASLLIIVDFAFSGSILTDAIVSLDKERQEYYNAAGNSHSSYKVITNAHEFSVSEEFAESVKENEKIEYAISPIFKEVNWYKIASSTEKFYYSLRVMSGFVLPLLVIIAMIVAYRTNKNIAIVVFILQVLLTANLVFLIQ